MLKLFLLVASINNGAKESIIDYNLTIDDCNRAIIREITKPNPALKGVTYTCNPQPARIDWRNT